MSVLDDVAHRLTAGGEPAFAAGEREQLAIHLLDGVGAWIAGRATEEGHALAALRTPKGKAPTFLGDGPLDRMAVRIATTRLTEVDDIHRRSCVTPGSVVVWAGLAFAGVAAPDAARFAASLRAGYEVMTRLGTAISGPAILYRGIWPTYLTAPAGAAAIAARSLGLDASETADALAIALTLSATGAGAQNERSSRWLLLGLAARTGASAALSAANGFGGDHTLLDADWLDRAHGIKFDPAPMLADSSAIASLSIKPWCSAKQAIAAVDAFHALLAAGLAPDEIESVTVQVPPAYARMIGGPPTSGRLSRITSVAYQFALAAYHPELVLELDRKDVTAEPRVANLVGRVKVVPDESLAGHYPEHWPARVEVTSKSGAKMDRLVLDARGDPEVAFNLPAATEKFHRLTDLPLGRDKAQHLATLCLRAIEHDASLAELLTTLDAIDA